MQPAGTDQRQAPGFEPVPESLRKPQIFSTPLPEGVGPHILFTPLLTDQGPKVFVTPIWDQKPTLLTTPVEGPKLTTVFLSKADQAVAEATKPTDVKWATTAVENNFFPALIMTGLVVYELYDVAITYKEEGAEAAAKKAAFYAAEWAVKNIAGKAISKALKAGEPAIDVLLKHCPAMGKIMDKVGIAYVAAEQKVFSTVVRKALHKADRAVANAASRIKVKVTGDARGSPTTESLAAAAEAGEKQWFSKYWSKPKDYTFNGQSNRVYQRNDLIDPSMIHPERGITNLEAMKRGYAPVGPDNQPINLHHLIQDKNGGIAEVTRTFHQQNTKVIHINPKNTESGINRARFDRWRESYWQERAKDFQ